MNKKVIEGTAWFDHAGYGMCLLPNGPSLHGEVILIENDFPTEEGPGNKQTQLLPNEWHGMKVRLTIEVINDYVSPEHKKFYDPSLDYRWEDEEKADYGVEVLLKEFRERLYGKEDK